MLGGSGKMEDSLERVYFLSAISLGSRYFLGKKRSVFLIFFFYAGEKQPYCLCNTETGN